MLRLMSFSLASTRVLSWMEITFSRTVFSKIPSRTSWSMVSLARAKVFSEPMAFRISWRTAVEMFSWFFLLCTMVWVNSFTLGWS